MKTKFAVLAIFILFAAIAWQWVHPSRQRQKLVLTGSSTVAPLVAEIGKRFEALHDGVQVDVQSGGSARGITDARSGAADIGMVSRALKDDEQDLQAFTIAMDGIGMIVNSANPIATLGKQQIIDIFTGKTTTWKTLNGKDAAITVVSKAEGRSTLELFLHFTGLKSSDLKPTVIIGDNQQGIKTVAGNPDAIGYVSIGAAEYEASQHSPIKLLPLEGVAASMENVKSGRFPLSRPLNLVTNATPENLAKAFIDFARSEKANDIVQAQFFVPIQH